MNHPLTEMTIRETGPYLVASTIKREPETAPVFREYAATLDGADELNSEDFEDEWLAVVTRVVGSISVAFGDQVKAHLIQQVVEGGLAIAAREAAMQAQEGLGQK